ncbi:MAG: helix-turn-helix transcriptional regulator [Microbacteriaceae bacterium]|nr:helix-turn-helix transcriptional regulator [Microbacteriaceae bacterium]
MSPTMTAQVFQVLLSLADGPKHGYAMILDIRERTGGEMDLTPSTLYDALARLSDQRLILEIPAPAKTASADSRRRYYQLTKAGHAAAQEETARLARLLDMARAKKFHV